MFTAIYKKDDRILRTTKLEKLASIDKSAIVWIDMLNANDLERKQVEKIFQINFENVEYALANEKFLKFIEIQDAVILQSHYILSDNNPDTEYKEYLASQVLKSGALISLRNNELKSFNETRKKTETNPKVFSDGFNVLITIFEIRLGLNANILMEIGKEIELLGKSILKLANVNEAMLLDISTVQEKTMMVRENLIEYQRLFSVMFRCEQFPRSTHARLSILLKEIEALMQQIDFIFERLNYLQNTLMGLINLAQNNIIKIFTVFTIMFMPPTLIAGIYGMNFVAQPELKWDWGYPMSFLMMLSSSSIIYLIFRRKKWL